MVLQAVANASKAARTTMVQSTVAARKWVPKRSNTVFTEQWTTLCSVRNATNAQAQ
jgi:hypothetical protein